MMKMGNRPPDGGFFLPGGKHTMLLSKSAYARHMGVSRQTVYGWIARGEIVISGDKVDVEASQAKQNSAGAGAGAGEHHNAMTWAQAAAWVWGHDGGKELPADINAGQRIEAAAAELGFELGKTRGKVTTSPPLENFRYSSLVASVKTCHPLAIPAGIFGSKRSKLQLM
ncbi:hypothetical protein ACY0KE_001612 [Klebsiella pneumoniae]